MWMKNKNINWSNVCRSFEKLCIESCRNKLEKTITPKPHENQMRQMDISFYKPF